ncbi:MAG: hypothetical protein HZA90_21850 [Verrucomicrobia bacterium]|nr:hypothetical protein [Verrucomicrobiota bacterium]
MAKPHYLPPKDQDRVVWLNNFAGKLPTHKVTVGLADADVVSAQADAAAWQWIVGWNEAMRTRAQTVTAYKNQLRNGPAGAATAPPAAPEYAAAPLNVAPDLFGRIGMLVQRIKNHPAYTEVIGQDLGIVAAQVIEDPQSAKPVLIVSLVDGGHVNVGWKKGSLDGIRLEVDRGTGWQFLAVDTNPDYTDNAPLPPVGQSAIWKYRGIYLLGDDPVGQWSDAASVAVMGS